MSYVSAPTDPDRPAPLPPPEMPHPITPQSWRLHANTSDGERLAVVGWTAARPVMVPLDGPTDRVVVPDPERLVFLEFIDPLDGRELARLVRETVDEILAAYGERAPIVWSRVVEALTALRAMAGQV